MPPAPRLDFLIAESEPPAARETRRESVGRSSGETYEALLAKIAPGARSTRITPADRDACLPDAAALEGYDAVFLTGSPLHLYEETAETRRVVAFMQAVFASRTPSFGSCAGLQIATVAAGGTVRAMEDRREAGFARRIFPTAEGMVHPLLANRPAAFDAPAIHSDEVAELPPGATLLASNLTTRVQAAEIRFGGGVFWGVQYHPEISLFEVAEAHRRQADDLVEHGLAQASDDIAHHSDLIAALHDEPGRRDLAWRLGLDAQVTQAEQRSLEILNFVRALVLPARSARGRD